VLQSNHRDARDEEAAAERVGRTQGEMIMIELRTEVAGPGMNRPDVGVPTSWLHERRVRNGDLVA
jgi:hypothetical protein